MFGDFLIKRYRLISSMLLATGLFLAFLLGYGQGKAQAGGQVTLSCSDDVLASLSVPLSTLASGEAGTLTSEERANSETSATVAGGVPTVPAVEGAFVGSKNGTKYYRPECVSARIKPENYVWFKDVQDAQLQGYTEASC
ncbi:MAG TPA: hypothetical protein VG982_01275 [Candidatus Paceibacterota bacterium]|nr:hypothetical protein [Candidatus Paceibacterota bacterium]